MRAEKSLSVAEICDLQLHLTGGWKTFLRTKAVLIVIVQRRLELAWSLSHLE